jgi:hypothetical protein
LAGLDQVARAAHMTPLVRLASGPEVRVRHGQLTADSWACLSLTTCIIGFATWAGPGRAGQLVRLKKEEKNSMQLQQTQQTKLKCYQTETETETDTKVYANRRSRET